MKVCVCGDTGCSERESKQIGSACSRQRATTNVRVCVDGEFERAAALRRRARHIVGDQQHAPCRRLQPLVILRLRGVRAVCVRRAAVGAGAGAGAGGRARRRRALHARTLFES